MGRIYYRWLLYVFVSTTLKYQLFDCNNEYKLVNQKQQFIFRRVVALLILFYLYY